MRIPFLAGRGPGPDDDPERRKLLVPEGRVPRPFPGPWTLRALVRGDGAPGAPLESRDPEPRAPEPQDAGAGPGPEGDPARVEGHPPVGSDPA
jgi:hypothetical protein